MAAAVAPTPRRHFRLSHLTLSHVILRMRKGEFSVRDIVEASGLAYKTVLELLNILERTGVITYLGKTLALGPGGRRERLFREVR